MMMVGLYSVVDYEVLIGGRRRERVGVLNYEGGRVEIVDKASAEEEALQKF
jgi:hypothetical protein